MSSMLRSVVPRLGLRTFHTTLRNTAALPSKTTESIPTSSCPENTVIEGVNYLKGQPPVLARPDAEYPAWLWTATSAKAKQFIKGLEWVPESSGTEIWRLGTPDKSSGEYKRGDAPDTTKTLQPEQYRVYWGNWDFAADFPNGVNYTIGESNEAEDWNTVHWSVFGPRYKNPVVITEKVSNWTLNFNIGKKYKLESQTDATLTVQLAGAKTAAGNTDVYNSTEPYANLPLSVYINDHPEPLVWTIPYHQSSSCIVRSATVCYQLRNLYKFPSEWLKTGKNTFVFALPYQGSNYESAFLPGSLYVQYDALRLEVA